MVLFWWLKPRRLFWSVLVEWNFWSGKTFFTEFESYELAFKNPDYLIISNIPFSRVDINYNSFADFSKILDHLYRYFALSNTELKDLDKYKNILFIMDEVHLYFPARASMDKSRAKIRNKLNTILTQCRKRNVKFYFITQRVQKTDIEFRRLSEFIYYLNFNRFFGLPINRLSIIRAWWWISDLIWEDWTTWENEEELKKDVIYSWLWKHNTVFFRSQEKMLHKDWALWKEKHITNWICWVKPTDWEWNINEDDDSDSIYNLSFDEFYSLLLKKPSGIMPIFSVKNRDWIPRYSYWYKYYDYENMHKNLLNILFNWLKAYKIDTSIH